ncbi:hypothetical protein KIH74_28170 [Kineosporia sp. J2-2]|uniref:MinD-like ATPase involved in chromosome partitioning or flagellar assembly n=1 Tax=Kineosporia corallincola TaxID=2835133 RepID=A0ABS5TP30_9ACTN|nr:hypothetical protein [Kineosporia corallincola]MBT0772851.1 hypothetical protein [Kineosporia corallincola]
MIEQRTVPEVDVDEDDWLDARPGRPPVLGAGLALPEVPGTPAATLTQAEPQPADVVHEPVAPGPAQVHWEEMPETPLAERPFPGAMASAGDPVPARWGWRNRVRQVSAGLIQPAPGAEEKAFRDEIDTIRRSTWTRSVNVLVTNPKGGSGKTPAALVLAGVLGSLRGGYVVAWEATESAGTLARRCEGGQGRGLAEMLSGISGITSAGRLGGYTAPQTSNADVIASAGPRDMLSAPQMLSVREVLDTYYRITVTDTGNNPGHETYRAALRIADAVLIPCLVSVDALAGVEQTLRLIESASGPVDLRERVVVVLGHDGGPEEPGTAEAVRRRLGELRTAAVIEVPFDPLIRRGGEISLSALSEESRRAWTRAAAAVVRALSAANSDIDLVAQTRAEIG